MYCSIAISTIELVLIFFPRVKIVEKIPKLTFWVKISAESRIEIILQEN